MISQELQHKIDSGIRLLQAVSQAHGGAPLEVAYSGGKDSDVVLQLVRESGVPFRAIYRNTTIDPPGTISHCKAQGVEIRHPKRTFFEMIEAKGLPNRKKRFCCAELKEYKILDVVVLGVRRDESPKRAAIYKEPTACRYYGAHKPENYTEQIYPILNWSIDDVRSFVADRNIKLAPHYYDPDGSLHFERRLGCIGCPLQSQKKRIAAFKRYPKMLAAMIKRLEKYLSKKPANSRNAYEIFSLELYCKTKEQREAALTGGLFGKAEAVDFEKFIKNEFFTTDLNRKSH